MVIKMKYIRDYVSEYLCNEYKITDEQCEIKWVDAISLFCAQRIDLPIKYCFVKCYVEKQDMEWITELYLAHIASFTNGSFEEQGNKKKKGKEVYLNTFCDLIDSIRLEDKWEKSAIPVGENGVILDGAHRVAICAYHGKKVPVVVIPGTHADYGYAAFKKSLLEEKYLDAMCNEYINIMNKKNIYAACLWPVVFEKNEVEFVRSRIKEYGKIIYEKEIKLSEGGFSNLMPQVYEGFEWIGNEKNHYSGAKGKTLECYDGNGKLNLFIFEGQDLTTVLELKEEIRTFLNHGKDSIHITDNNLETKQICEILLNHNSIHLLNSGAPLKCEKLNKKITEFKHMVNLQKEDISAYIIDSSSVLGLYGIRQPGDMDYLKLENHSLIKLEETENHSKYLELYSKPLEQLILCPENYLVYRGVKFITLSILKEFKSNRAQEKDIEDIKAIERFQGSSNKYDEWKYYAFIFEQNVQRRRNHIKYKISIYLKRIGIWENLLPLWHLLKRRR